MKKSTVLVTILGGVFLLLALTNPSAAGFREHIREKQGVAGSLGMAMADLVSGSKKGGIQRDNYIIASRFYIGGDGIIPRKNLAWGGLACLLMPRIERHQLPPFLRASASVFHL